MSPPVGGSVSSFCNGGGSDVILACRISKSLKNKCRKHVRYFGLQFVILYTICLLLFILFEKESTQRYRQCSANS